MNPDPAYGGNVDSTGRPLILPGVFSSEEDFCEWTQHFESVAVINKWDDITKLQWLHMRVAGKAHVALSRVKSASYKQAREALQERFEPSSKVEFYKDEFRHSMKRETERWGDFADRLGLPRQTRLTQSSKRKPEST